MVYIIVGWLKQLKKIVFQQENKLENNISVVIAFRNESDNIIACLSALEKQLYGNNLFEVVLINDHSEDNSVEQIEGYQEKSKLNIQLLHLSSEHGKKAALKLGIENANYCIIASTDADCEVPVNWLSYINQSFNNNNNETAMLLGPVGFKEQTSNNLLLDGFQELDFLAMQALTFGALGNNLPILNNGANIAYRKVIFENVNGFDKHKTPSGDDVFLLEKFISQQQVVNGILDKKFIVKTDRTTTFSAFLQQRLRWASKAKKYKNNNLIYFSSIVYLSNLIQLLIYAEILLVDSFWVVGIILLTSKWLIDFILLYLAANFFNKKKHLVLFVFVVLIYPIYIVFIGLLALITDFKWKGRKYHE
ncbi:MAG: glycosyltransferase [Flavobacteriales bacterium]|nr:glycosyltransferase [Flavobacteriales bacterium]